MSETAPEGTDGAASRPKERVMRRMADAGVSDTDIAWRFRCSPGHVQRILRLSQIPRPGFPSTQPSRPSAIERTVRKARRHGATHAEIAARLRRTPGFVARVERFATLRP